ncbi:hypothetical protein DCAR_0519583 [Daucus carota subsp. sativus]|uniref:Uncharacterized protein n=1 Tax=Daucus carota subsp. sativus TaxID=79200 RepID=A0A164Y2G6_DAUCS|nr:hypothetical protein DCAR_0519583 [Daucus carota subsp. sativus]
MRMIDAQRALLDELVDADIALLSFPPPPAATVAVYHIFIFCNLKCMHFIYLKNPSTSNSNQTWKALTDHLDSSFQAHIASMKQNYFDEGQ